MVSMAMWKQTTSRPDATPIRMERSSRSCVSPSATLRQLDGRDLPRAQAVQAQFTSTRDRRSMPADRRGAAARDTCVPQRFRRGQSRVNPLLQRRASGCSVRRRRSPTVLARSDVWCLPFCRPPAWKSRGPRRLDLARRISAVESAAARALRAARPAAAGRQSRWRCTTTRSWWTRRSRTLRAPEALGIGQAALRRDRAPAPR